MSIHLGTTKATKFPIGETPLLFTIAGNNKLIYPNLLFKSNPGIVTEYINWGACQQVALLPAYSAAYVDQEGVCSDIYHYTGNGWRQFGNSGVSAVYGNIRYRTELRFTRPRLNGIVTIGYALMGTNTSTLINGVQISIDNDWHAYDFTFSAVLYPGGVYAIVIKDGTSYVSEQNAVATFIPD